MAKVRVAVTYGGGHNFDLDIALEKLAGGPRQHADMTFESMKRCLIFEFNEQQAKLFAAAVTNRFPEMDVIKIIAR